MRTFEKVEEHPEPLVASDETYSQSKFDRVGVPNSERFLDISCCSISLNFFFRIYTFDVLSLSARGKTAKNFYFSWSFRPFFFDGQGVPN